MPAGTGYVSSRSCAHDPSTRTQQPIVTGTAVLGLKYKDGVMLAADTLGQSDLLIHSFVVIRDLVNYLVVCTRHN